ncbi:hypothetical protein [Candidatus Pelagibacter sp.]|uniref:hypothetical protein n=1 Tax=Candidatus Pelagibacter sp. TaxID=2024849 RepID=UPI003F845DC0|tara:strand:+ start:5047 stop:5781 length:735 start_codon:yes stop_codon:yes gene_type:complete
MINFNNSNFFYDPFPHCVLNNFLDNDIYEKICAEYPDLDYFEEVKSKTSDNKFKKYRFSNNTKNFTKFIDTTVETKKFYDYLNTDEFTKNINNFLLSKQVDLRIDTNNKKSLRQIIKNFFLRKSSIDFEFSSIPIKNGFILPHTDGGNKLLGFVIPIIDDDNIFDINNLGTKILKAKTDKYRYNFYNKTVPFEETELVRELPFKKNQMSLHVKTFNSLHGVGPIEDKNNLKIEYRKSISVFLLK